MERHHRDLIRQLFVCATELLEDAHEIAVAGQNPPLKRAKALALARQLQSVSADVAVLMDAVAVINNARGSRASERRNRSSKLRHRTGVADKSGA